MDELRRVANDWAPAIQAVAAIAAIFVGLVAVRVAGGATKAEQDQATAANEALRESRRQIDAAAASDRDRQRDLQVASVQPLLLQEPGFGLRGGRADGESVVSIVVQVPAQGPMLDLRFILRHDAIPAYATVVERGSFAPGATVLTQLAYEPLLAHEPFDAPHELIVEYKGLLGQRVIEHYAWFMADKLMNVERGRLRWHLSRLEVVPNVAGASSLDLQFDRA